ncbi:hypothetical protein OEZ86_005206 [Tetradesmus obliquus]|nr:hypothetical protein OEZ86_005206 [Tetradesmus obliquus]
MGYHPSTKNTACSGRVASCFTLPTPMLVHVLNYLQPAQRLGKAALVCRAWREAANAATSSIAFTFKWADYDASKRQLASMTAWLERGAAQQVTSINLDYGWGEDEDVCLEVSLPLQQLCKLRSLRLISFDLLEEPPLCSSSSSSIAGINPLAAMSSSLTALELYDVTLPSFNSMPELFRCMASLSQLQRLELTSVRVEPPTYSFAELMSNRRRGSCSSAYTYTLADALCQMPQLTRLQLDVQTECQLHWKHSPGPMGAAIAGLQQLQQLELSTLDVPKAEPHTLFMQLPASITLLHVGRACVTFTPAETPCLARLTALRDLKLMRVLGMDPAVLCSSAGTLTQLQLGLAWDNRSLSALVRMLQHLQQLQSVWLYHNPYGDDRDAEPPAPQLSADDCALLLSPAKLTSLTLTGLTKLNIYESDLKGWGAEVLKTMRECGIQLQSKASQPLWQQLYNLCRDHNIECVWELLEEQEELVEQQAQQLQQQALQLQDAQLRVMQLQQQLAAAGAGGIMLGEADRRRLLSQHGPPFCAALARLQQLQQLDLCVMSDDGSLFDQLPASLTLLQLDVDSACTPKHAPALAALSALRHLQLGGVRELDTAVLANSAASLTSLQIAHKWQGAGQLRGLLQMIPQMQQLQQLELTWLRRSDADDGIRLRADD